MKLGAAKRTAPTRPHPDTPPESLVLRTLGVCLAVLDRIRDLLTGRREHTSARSGQRALSSMTRPCRATTSGSGRTGPVTPRTEIASTARKLRRNGPSAPPPVTHRLDVALHALQGPLSKGANRSRAASAPRRRTSCGGPRWCPGTPALHTRAPARPCCTYRHGTRSRRQVSVNGCELGGDPECAGYLFRPARTATEINTTAIPRCSQLLGMFSER